MLRRDLRTSYHSFVLSQEQKDAMMTDILQTRVKDNSMRGRKWRPRGQWASWTAIVLVILLVFGALGFAAWHFGLISYVSGMIRDYKQAQEVTTEPTLPETTEPSETLPAETAPPTTLPEEATPSEPLVPEGYQQIIQKYLDAIHEGWDLEQCDQAGISLLTAYLEAPDQLRYTHMDLDENGVMELLVTDGNVLYGLYTQVDEEVVTVLTGAERCSYQLTQENVLINVASGGAANTVHGFYRYSGGNLIVDQLIVYDGHRDPNNPWFRGFVDPETATPISEAEAKTIMDSYKAVYIPCKPITAYN